MARTAMARTDSRQPGGTERTRSVHTTLTELVARARAEYREMPGLCLTLHQAQRLWSLDRETCQRVIEALSAEGTIRQTRDGRYRAVR